MSSEKFALLEELGYNSNDQGEVRKLISGKNFVLTEWEQGVNERGGRLMGKTNEIEELFNLEKKRIYNFLDNYFQEVIDESEELTRLDLWLKAAEELTASQG